MAIDDLPFHGPYPEYGPYPEKEPGTGTSDPPAYTRDWTTLKNTLHSIVNLTNHDSPGIYEAITIEKINNLARSALGMPDVARGRPNVVRECWSYSQPKKRTEDSPVMRKVTLPEQALEKLSGDLSYDNVAAAKQILKEIIG